MDYSGASNGYARTENTDTEKTPLIRFCRCLIIYFNK